MKQPLILIIMLAVALMTFHAAENIRLARAPSLIAQELSPAQVTAMLAAMDAKGIKLHPAKYWNAVK